MVRVRIKADQLDDGDRFYLLGNEEPCGPLIMENTKWLKRLMYRRPQSDQRERICGSEEVFLSWKDACIRMAEQLEARASRLGQDAKLLRNKAEE